VTREQRGVAHLLVIPVLHVPTILELPDRLSAPLLRRVRDAATWIVTAYQPAGVAVWQNNGTAAGQAVDHLADRMTCAVHRRWRDAADREQRQRVARHAQNELRAAP